MFKNLEYETFIKIIDNLHDEIMVFDNNYNLVYLNKASYRHYGISPYQLIGSKFKDLNNVYWNSSTLPVVYKTKKVTTQMQRTLLGTDIITISVPILDNDGEIEYVVMNVNDMNSKDEFFYENLTAKYKENEYDNNLNQESIKIIYNSKKMHDIMDLANKISKIKSPCLILGETGTGKSMIAKYIHMNSNRKDRPFVSINCASINRNLIESELFGYTKGSFSGANREGKKGFIEIANGGTLFLDEISEIPYDLQSKLLHVIQEEEYIPVGGEKSIKVDLKIIAATNSNLEKMMSNNKFRKDLYYRLNVFEINIPSLRERFEDITKLTYYYLNFYNNKYKRNHTISNKALNIITNYSWPGNIRELSNVIERCIVTVTDIEIQPYHLPKELYELNNSKKCINLNNKSLDTIIDSVKKEIILETYKKYKK